MKINTEYHEEVMKTLTMNIGLLGTCLKKDDVNPDDVDKLIKDTFDFISDHASRIEVKHPYITENIINTVIMVLMHGSLKDQEEQLSLYSSSLGVPKETVMTKLTKKMVDAAHKHKKSGRKEE